jgi:DNA polymerase-3 subunit gamma/tau
MSYTVLARKWRPRSFEELVGQTHVQRALINALENNRIHHAYLFTGTRGVGKTTIARILAKSLNCETGVTAKPCGQCATCNAIDEGRFVDLIEVDAASRTKVEDTRELLDNVQYTPTQGRYKVYLIDEVHMLSSHSFNALLKTLEEPPPHVKFLLATTDPQKLPVTILSRCLQFNLKRLPIDMIANHLSAILKSEKIKFEPAAVNVIARAADGSMRDALSLLDQALAYGNEALSENEVCEMLGTIEQDHLYRLLDTVVSRDAAQTMQIIDQLAERAPDYSLLLADLVSLLHRIAVIQVVPDCKDEYFEDFDKVKTLASAMSEQDAQLYYQIALESRKDLALNPDMRAGFEMVFLRMIAFRPVPDDVQTLQAPVAPTSGTKKVAGSAKAATPKAKKQPVSTSAKSGAESGVEAQDAGEVDISQPVNTDMSGLWEQWISAMRISGPSKQVAQNSVLQSVGDKEIELIIHPKLKQICNETIIGRLEQAISELLNKTIKIKMLFEQPREQTPMDRVNEGKRKRHEEAVESIQEDETVQELQNVLDAELRPDLVQSNLES